MTKAVNKQGFITNVELADKPISELLYSHFIELGYGIQVEPMWNEMLFNRSFEPFKPYKGINIEWYDLWHDRRNHSKGYETDWSKFDWYHSGYEHNSWYAAPGEQGPIQIHEHATFMIGQSPVLDIEIISKPGGSGHGEQSIQIVNRELIKWGGLAQEGKFLRKGESYRFSGQLRSDDADNAEIRLYRTGDWEEPIVARRIEGVHSQYATYTVDFVDITYEGWATFVLWIPPQSTFEADDFSLKPLNTVHGWRPEIVEALKRVGPKVIRFPGGCFASFYDWRDGVGTYSQRRPQPSYFWGGQNYNDVGTAEMAMLGKAVKSELMFCVNVYHPLKEKYDHYFDEQRNVLMGYEFPQFTDIEEGARQAADWVAYCNLPAGSHRMADLRAAHGYEEPFDVRFWELDNEVHRWFGWEDYAHAAVVYARAMKAVDPSIQIGLVTYGGDETISFHSKLRQMLDIAGPSIDFLADRHNAEDGLDEMLSIMREYNESTGSDLKYCNTEKLFYEGEPDDQNRFDYEGEITKSFMFGKWIYALQAATEFLSFQRRGGDVLFVNFNNLANTHSQCVIDTPKEGAYLTAAGRVMELLSKSPAAWTLQLEGKETRMTDEFQLQAAWDLERKRLVLNVLNRTNEDVTAVFDYSSIGKRFNQAHSVLLSAPGPLAMNKLDHPNAIQQEEWMEDGLIGEETFEIHVPKYGFAQIVLE